MFFLLDSLWAILIDRSIDSRKQNRETREINTKSRYSIVMRPWSVSQSGMCMLCTSTPLRQGIICDDCKKKCQAQHHLEIHKNEDTPDISRIGLPGE